MVNCRNCKQEIPVGKYYELYKENDKIGDYCSPCWTKEQVKYEPHIKKGLLKVIERERERERESKMASHRLTVASVLNVKRERLSVK